MAERKGDKKPEISQPTSTGYPPPYAYYPQEDEINLIDLWNVLAKRKYTILLFTAIATMCALAYALLAPSIYKAEVVFQPPHENDIQALKIAESKFQPPHENDIKAIDFQGNQDVIEKMAYNAFKINLASIAPRKAVFDRMKLSEYFALKNNKDKRTQDIFNVFNKRLSVTINNQKIGLAMEGKNPVLIADILNQIGEETLQSTANEVVLNIQNKARGRRNKLKSKIELLRENAKFRRMEEVERLNISDTLERKLLEDQINILKTSAKQKRLDHIERLKEAAKIAHTLGIKDPIDYRLSKINAIPLSKPVAIINITPETQRLYEIGFKAIETEIKSLSNRKTDDPFIPQLRDLQAKLSLLNHNRKAEQLKNRKNDDPFIQTLRDIQLEIRQLDSIQIDPTTLKTARLAEAAYPPEQRIRPKRKQIVFFGVIVGLMMGISVALFLNFLENNKNRLKGGNH